MSIGEVGMQSAVGPEGEETDPAQLEWLLGMVQEAMAEVMGGESTPLQKANAVARLGSLYLKAYQTTALQQENQELTRKVEELEQRLAAVSAVTDEAPAAQKSAASRPRLQKLSRSRTLPPRGVARNVRRSTRRENEDGPFAR